MKRTSRQPRERCNDKDRKQGSESEDEQRVAVAAHPGVGLPGGAEMRGHARRQLSEGADDEGDAGDQQGDKKHKRKTAHGWLRVSESWFTPAPLPAPERSEGPLAGPAGKHRQRQTQRGAQRQADGAVAECGSQGGACARADCCPNSRISRSRKNHDGLLSEGRGLVI